MSTDFNPRKLDFPATGRNREVIAEVLGRFLEPTLPLRLLEIASGSGQHVAFLSERYPLWSFQPTDIEAAHLESVEAYRREQSSSNFASPVRLDVSQRPWALSDQMDAILAINLIHISPWACTEALFAEGREHLKPGGAIYLYGAFLRTDVDTAPSNIAFDQGLRQRNHEWGVRSLEAVNAIAVSNGFYLAQQEEMPANNLSLLWRLE